jgi:transcriptional regulator with XRE-family HTH domain
MSINFVYFYVIIQSREDENMNDNDYLKLIGERIKHHRKLLHMSQEELAHKCGYTTENARCMISRIEKGKINLPQSRMIALASALGVDATILFSDGIKI